MTTPKNVIGLIKFKQISKNYHNLNGHITDYSFFKAWEGTRKSVLEVEDIAALLDECLEDQISEDDYDDY